MLNFTKKEKLFNKQIKLQDNKVKLYDFPFIYIYYIYYIHTYEYICIYTKYTESTKQDLQTPTVELKYSAFY